MREYTETQIATAKAIRLIELNLEPKCDECGYGANRPNCAIGHGGACNRHDQEDVQAFKAVIRQLENESGLRDVFQWRVNMPLDVLYTFSEREINLLLDLVEYYDGRFTSRDRDERFSSLNKKGAVMSGHKDGAWTVNISPRGLEFLAGERKETEND